MATASEPAGVQALDKLVIEDHNKVRLLFTEYNKPGITPEIKQQLGFQIIRELSIHSYKEEAVFYPAMDKAFSVQDGQHLRDEHMDLKKALAKLSGMSADKDINAYDSQVHEVKRIFEQHVSEEEGRDLPRLLAAPGIDKYELGAQFEKEGNRAITRPHTWAPDKPPFNKIGAILTRPLDEFLDFFRFSGNTPTVAPPSSERGYTEAK